MSSQRRARVQQVLAGVLKQAVADALATHVHVCGSGADADFLRALCVDTLGPSSVQANGLELHPANKTTLLLTPAPSADILLLGDLYYSQVIELAGDATVPATVEQLAAACGGVQALDRALQRFFDTRAPWEAATAHLSGAARAQLQEQLESARFGRRRLGLVPKLGARTLGVDLYA